MNASRAHFELRIGHERVSAQRHLLAPAECSFPLQRSPREVRNLLRRQELPAVQTGARSHRRVDAEVLAGWLFERDDLLAVEYMRGWAEGRFEMPRAAHEHARPPHLLDRLELLRRGL